MSSSTPRRSLFFSREKTVHETPASAMSNSEDSFKWSHRRRSWTNRKLGRQRRPGNLRSGAPELHSSQSQLDLLPSSALDRIPSFRTVRSRRGNHDGKVHYKLEDVLEGSPPACDLALDVANGSIQALGTCKGDERSKDKRSWELACALAYAYLHQQPLSNHQAPHSAYEGGDPCRTLKQFQQSSDPDLHVLMMRQHMDAITEVVNPTQAAEWFGDRYSSPAASVS